MPIVTPIPIDALPPAPQPTDSAPDFNSKSFAMIGALDGFVTQTNAIAVATKSNADSAMGSANDATQAALVASDASAAAVGAAHFKGLWSSMTGALSKPATVKHNGRFWLLLNDLANVALSEPSVTADWTSLDAGRIAQEATANTAMVAGVVYVAKTAGITFTLPATPLTGDFFALQNASSDNVFADFGTTPLKGEVQAGAMRIPKRRGFEITYSGSTYA